MGHFAASMSDIIGIYSDIQDIVAKFPLPFKNAADKLMLQKLLARKAKIIDFFNRPHMTQASDALKLSADLANEIIRCLFPSADLERKNIYINKTKSEFKAIFEEMYRNCPLTLTTSEDYTLFHNYTETLNPELKRHIRCPGLNLVLDKNEFSNIESFKEQTEHNMKKLHTTFKVMKILLTTSPDLSLENYLAVVENTLNVISKYTYDQKKTNPTEAHTMLKEHYQPALHQLHHYTSVIHALQRLDTAARKANHQWSGDIRDILQVMFVTTIESMNSDASIKSIPPYGFLPEPIDPLLTSSRC